MSTSRVPLKSSIPVIPQIKPAPREITNITEKAVCVVLTRSRLGKTKTVDNDEIKPGVQTDLDSLHISKELYDCPELKAIYSLDDKIDTYIRWICLPSLFKRSVYLLPADLVMRVDEALCNHLIERAPLIEKFIEKYDEIVAASMTRLGALSNSSDYPPKEKVKDAFRFSWEYVEFGPSAKLKQINMAMYNREKEKAEERWKEASELVTALLRKQTLGLIDHMVELVTPAEDGKKKKFRKKAFDKINAFLSVFDERNLTNDGELKKLVDQARGILNGVSPENLKDDAIRSSFESSFTAIKKELNTLVTDAPIRSFRFGNSESVEEPETETEN